MTKWIFFCIFSTSNKIPCDKATHVGCVPLRKSTESPAVLPAICHFHRGHPRRAAGAGNMGKVQEVFFFFLLFLSLGGVFVSLYCGHVLRARHFCRALLRTATLTERRSEEDKRKGKEHRGPSAG